MVEDVVRIVVEVEGKAEVDEDVVVEALFGSVVVVVVVVLGCVRGQPEALQQHNLETRDVLSHKEDEGAK